MGVFNSNLKRLRLLAGFNSAKDFASLLDIPYHSYMNYENKSNQPKFDVLLKIADALHVSTDELLGHHLELIDPYIEKLHEAGVASLETSFLISNNDKIRFENLCNQIVTCLIPCVRDQHGEIKKQKIKQLVMKIQEEFLELVAAVYVQDFLDSTAEEAGCTLNKSKKDHIASEAADLKTAVTTLEEAIGIQNEMRNQAMKKVYESNLNKGRL